MTTKKQAEANKANSKKSTGAKTEQGKQIVALNSVKHGLFSTRLIMPFESADEYGQLLDGLIDSLNPDGSVEQLLVEKVAVAMWRQLRLTRAESAGIEMSRSIYQSNIRQQVQNLTSDSYDSLSASDFKPATAEQVTQVGWCRKVIKEFRDLLEDASLNDIEHIKKSPEIMKQLVTETKQDEHDTVQEYVDTLSSNLGDWVIELVVWCEAEINKAEQKVVTGQVINAALEIVQSKESAPIKNELLIRYQVALDRELYKALEALRKQQEWRLKSGGIIEAEAV